MPQFCNNRVPSASIAIAIASMIVFGVTATAEAQIRVTGFLRSQTGVAIAGATIRLEGFDIVTPRTTTTGANGSYAFDNVTPGIRVRVVALLSGRLVARAFALITLPVEIVDLVGTPTESLTLRPEDLAPGREPSGEVRGLVTTPGGTPIVGARVAIGDTGVAATTDSTGRYSFGKLRSGLVLDLQASANAYGTAAAQALVPENETLAVDITLSPESRTREAGARLSVLDAAADRETVVLRPADVSGLPGLVHSDLLRAVQFVAGIEAGVEIASDLHVRGGSAGETAIALDGFTWYPFTHLSPAFGGLNPAAIGSASFSQAASSVVDGNRLSGTLNLTGATAAAGRPGGAIELSGLGWGAHGSVPLGRHASFLLAARGSSPASLYNQMLDALSGGRIQLPRGRAARFSGGPFELQPASSFRDVNATLAVQPNPSDQVSVTLYDARDGESQPRDIVIAQNSDIAIPTSLVLPADATAEISDVSEWSGRGISASWEHRWSSRVTSRLRLGRSEFSREAAGAVVLTSPSTGLDYPLAAGPDGSSALTESNRLRDTTIRLETTLATGFAHAFTGGGEIKWLDAGYSSSAERTSVTDGEFSSALAPLVDATDVGTLATVFLQDVWRPTGRLIISPGARLSRWTLTDRGFLDPRVTMSYQLHPWVRAHAGWSIDHQVVNRIAREDRLHGDGDFWALSDATSIPTARAQQGSGGLTAGTAGLRVEGTVYFRKLDDLTLLAPRLLPGAAPDPATNMFHVGAGTAKGLELLIQSTSERNDIWASLAARSVRYEFLTLQEQAFPASFDRPVELKIADTFGLSSWWTGSAAFVAASGARVTPASVMTPVWFPDGESANQLTFGTKNSERLPSYHRLDASTKLTFTTRAMATELGVTVLNVYNRRNIASREFAVAGTTFTSSDVLFMGRTVNVFLRLGF